MTTSSTWRDERAKRLFAQQVLHFIALARAVIPITQVLPEPGYVRSDKRCEPHRIDTAQGLSMLKKLALFAGAAIILATFAGGAEARQIEPAAPMTERIAAQRLAGHQSQAPCFWLVLGVGY